MIWGLLVAALAVMTMGAGEVGGDRRLFAEWFPVFARRTIGGGSWSGRGERGEAGVGCDRGLFA